ncbi:NAD-dependent histone deacetylase HST3 [Termitomyces sp. T112]|nr:NAD-dependent histone deacetylase HST3 [Termitomyces sp. T112]
MTLFVPLEADTPLPSSPFFLTESVDPQVQISRIIKFILKAKRIVVICGAGISVQAGIPDFRSTDGLFKSLKRDNPREALASGKDLFDASVFNSEHSTALFCQMIAQLWSLSQAAKPTAFHNVLRALDDRGKLLRVFTQNIDAIEEKCGLSFGVPEFEDKRCKGRPKAPMAAECPVKETLPSGASKLPCPSSDLPRCVPLHGTLQSMHCQICNCSFPLEEYLPSLTLGQPPQCPECTSLEATRQLIGKRARGVGKLRPSVVLYNEAHKDGEGVGEVVKKDLIGSSKGKGRSGADLLLVVGTSLRVPGTKRMVREFAKAVRSRGIGSSRNSPSPSSSPRPSTATDEEPTTPAMKAIYLNLDFPVPTREWEGVFDAWIQGDAQVFAEMLQAEIEREARAKELALEKKKRREEVTTQVDKPTTPKTPKAQSKAGSDAKIMKRKYSSPSAPPEKKRKIHFPPTPPKTPSLTLRIPPRPVISEVVVTTHSPILSYQNMSDSRRQQLITPEKSPPRRSIKTSARRCTAGASIIKYSHSNVTHLPVSVPQNVEFSSSSSNDPSDDEQDADAHVLPEIRRNNLCEIEVA